jgi:GxxExxY protein
MFSEAIEQHKERGRRSMKHQEKTHQIIGCAMQVHSELGCGFQEVIYQRCLEIEFRRENIPYVREFEMPVMYQEHQVGTRRVDFLVYDKIMVELKAVTELEDVHWVQAKNYLQAYQVGIGLLLNFGTKSLEFKRLFNNAVLGDG